VTVIQRHLQPCGATIGGRRAASLLNPSWEDADCADVNVPARERVIRALSDLAIRLSVAGGFTLGLLAGLQGHSRGAECPKDASCVGEALSSAIWSVFGLAVAGAVAGLLVALLAVLLLRRLRSRRPALRPIIGRWGAWSTATVQPLVRIGRFTGRGRTRATAVRGSPDL
jgi:hypothetical protein